MELVKKTTGITKELDAHTGGAYEALFVSRTAISKWNPARGYPSIDFLKEISRYFSVTIDDLICLDEMITVAENDKKEFVSKYVSAHM